MHRMIRTADDVMNMLDRLLALDADRWTPGDRAAERDHSRRRVHR